VKVGKMGKFIAKDSHKVERTVGDEEELLICIHKSFEEFPHVRILFYVFLYMVANNLVHHRVARSDGVLHVNIN
jgi:hypothetical protein